MQELEAALARMRSAWMAGGSALDHCPDAWRQPVAGHGEAALVALAGHATAVLFRHTPASPIEPRPLLPELALPILPDELRPLFRRILAAKGGPSIEQHLIALIACRGFAVHPADWLPSPQDDGAPDIYAPWIDWARAESRAKSDDKSDAKAGDQADEATLTVENYEGWSWASRRVALANLRIKDPAAALAIIAAKAAHEPAERRLRLLEILETRLSEADAAFLEGLAQDRSDRVRAIAQACLARLGRTAENSSEATELAAMVDIGKLGLFRSRTRLVVKALKNSAQELRRQQLFKLVGAATLARALGTSELRLVEAAPDGTSDGIDSFVQMMARTGSDSALRALLQVMLADAAPVRQLRALAPRLSADERRTLLPEIIARDTAELDTALLVAGRELGTAPLAPLLASAAYTELSGLLDAFRGEDFRQTPKHNSLGGALNRIALLLDATGAADLITRLGPCGLSPADPRLDLLRLNAALTREKTP